MENTAPKDVRQHRLTAAMLACQKNGQPVHTWPVDEVYEPDDWAQSYRTVGLFMSTDLFTVQPDDLIDLAASVMDWRHIRHVPVEDGAGHLVGLVTHRSLLRMISNGPSQTRTRPITVKEIMVAHPLTVSPSTSSLDAIEMMRKHKAGCLPVVEEDRLVGIVTSYDFLEASARLFKEQLGTSTPSEDAGSNDVDSASIKPASYRAAS